MKIYDISQEMLSSVVYPGDPAPQALPLARMKDGALCNVTALSMCAHNGTHVDAPRHFIDDGLAVDQVPLEHFVGPVGVFDHEGDVTTEDVLKMLDAYRAWTGTEVQRLLIKGKSVLTEEAARLLAERKLLLYGNESQTVGPEDAPMAVHLILLGAGMTLLEGVRLAHVPQGAYLLSAAPINFAGFDGAPCRALLMEL
ncbi:MAG: cyclase [Clostridiales bacterium]|nr:cyclase [Clostridiales bacterium]